MIDLTKARVAYTKNAIYVVHPEIQPHVIELTNYGTGCPEETLAWINIGLRLIAEKPPENTDAREGWNKWYAEHRKRCDAHFKSQGAEYLFYYFCDFHGLTEHGGSVPG